MNAVIIERRKDGTYWRHECSDAAFQIFNSLMRGPWRYTFLGARALMEKHSPDFLTPKHLVTTQVEEPKGVLGFEPTIIFVDEVATLPVVDAYEKCRPFEKYCNPPIDV